MRKFDRFLVPATYGLLGVTAALCLAAYLAAQMWPFYLAALLYTAVLLAYVLPASGDLINRRHDIGGVVVSLLLALVVNPAVLGVGGTVATAASALSVFEDFPGTDGGEPADYSSATTPQECEDIWFTDYSASAEADRDDCLERVGG